MKYKSTSALAVATALLTGLPGGVLAIPSSIEGTVSFSGSATTDTNNLSTSTKFISFQEVTVGSPATTAGDYDGTSGAAVTMTPFTWDPVGASIPINPLWTFVSGVNTYSFNLSSMSLDYVSPPSSGVARALCMARPLPLSPSRTRACRDSRTALWLGVI